MIKFRNEMVREEFHHLSPEVQEEFQHMSQKMIAVERSLEITFIDRWGFGLDDYEISFRIQDERELSFSDVENS